MNQYHHKPKRVLDPDHLAAIRNEPCLVCESLKMRQMCPTEADHITTRGAGGGDVKGNVWPQCTAHHAERHKTGIKTFIARYWVLRLWLRKHGRDDLVG